MYANIITQEKLSIKLTRNYMKYLILILSLLTTTANAGRSGETSIKNIVVKETHVEIYTTTGGACDKELNRWHLLNSHPNYEALVSGFFATKAAEKKVDIVGKGNCTGFDEIIWSYVLK